MRVRGMGLLALLAIACTYRTSISGGYGSGAVDAGTSPGSVTLNVTLPSTQSFCDPAACYPIAHLLWITDSSGQHLSTGSPPCDAVLCSSCMSTVCNGLCTGPNEAVALTAFEATWDGSTMTAATCGNAFSCVAARYVPAGRYVAHICATPGDLTKPDGGAPVCTGTGPAECTDLPFDLPSSGVVQATWQPSDAAVRD